MECCCSGEVEKYPMPLETFFEITGRVSGKSPIAAANFMMLFCWGKDNLFDFETVANAEAQDDDRSKHEHTRVSSFLDPK